MIAKISAKKGAATRLNSAAAAPSYRRSSRRAAGNPNSHFIPGMNLACMSQIMVKHPNVRWLQSPYDDCSEQTGVVEMLPNR
jgi:hypothetical protein